MKLVLDHTQRLNLHVLLGVQRVSIRDIKPVWELQDKLALTDAEKAAIELRVVVKDEQEREVWNPALSLPPKEIVFTEAEVGRIRTALESFQDFTASTTRRWLAPIIAKILDEKKAKG